MHSHIIINTDLDQGFKQALKLTNLTSASPDLLVVSPDKQASIGIDQIRQTASFLAIAPLQSPTKYALITHSHLLTTEAQQSLLKTLEEPPPNSGTVLITPHTHGLLPTILSRCQVHQMSHEPASPDTQELTEILTTPVLERFLLTHQYKDKSQALEFVQSLVSQSHQLMKINPDLSPVTTRLLETQKHLESNVHTTLALDTLWLDLPSV